MAKQMMFDDEARRKVLTGIQKLAGAVKVTLGPSGRNVILDRKGGAPQATKDGATVSKEVELGDPFENVGAKLANAVADKTNDVAGDGTTTSAILAEAIYAEGLKLITVGANPVLVKRGMDKAVEAAVEAIKKMSRPVKNTEDYRRVALIAAHGDEAVADLVAQAMDKVGKEGVITIEESKGFETTIELVGGLQFDKGFISPYFINKPESLAAEYDDPFILLSDQKISNLKEFVPILEQVARAGRALLIIAEDVEGDALAALVVNRLRGVIQAVAVKAPAFGDRRKAMLQDIAIVTGGKVVTEELGVKLENIKLSDLGRADRIKVEKERCTIVGGGGDKKAIELRVEELRTSIKKTTSDYDREKYEERLAKITGGVAILKVGGITETEMKERKFRVDDAVHAARAAAQEGIVPGGGLASLRAGDAALKLDLEGDEAAGARVIAKALEAPMANIAANAGHDPSLVLAETREKGGQMGLNAATGKYVDLMGTGVVDAAKVTRVALQNAASVTALLLTSRTVIVDIKEKKKAVAGAVK
jgi:chaperonin GroEL